jgi:uncharacterized delta-60 repeat protein
LFAWQAFFGLVVCIIGGTAHAVTPVIQFSPENETVLYLSPAGFGAYATGTPPLQYQWRKNGAPLAGATNDEFILPSVQFADAGVYSVVVSNLEGSATNAGATLTVTAPRAGDIDFSFNPSRSVNGAVRAIAIQPDGRMLIGGDFTMVNGAVRGHIARLNADGSTDFSFMSGLAGADDTNAVNSIALQADGKIVIGGAFGYVNGVARSGIARLNPDGSLDTGFQNGMSGVDFAINAVATQTNGQIVIAGGFTMVNGTNRNGIAQLNVDGSLDTGFLNGLTGVDAPIAAIAVQPDGGIVLGGDFTMVNGTSRNGIARLHTDGSLDTGFLNGLSGVNYPVDALAIQPDGNVLIGGGFTTVNGVSFNGIARLNTDGSVDNGFQNGQTGVNATIFAISTNASGKVVIAGNFTFVNGIARKGIAQLNADGSLDTTFLNNLAGANYTLFAVGIQPDQKVLCGGGFSSFNGTNRLCVARLNTDGSMDAAFQNGTPLNGNILCLAPQPDGKVLIGGTFITADSVYKNIARLNADGSEDTNFLTVSTVFSPNSSVNSIILQSDGRILVAGSIGVSTNGVIQDNVLRLNPDGSWDASYSTTNVPSGPNGTVAGAVLQPDGKLCVVGTFSKVNGIGSGPIARLNTDGSLDTNFILSVRQAPVSGTLFSIAMNTNGQFYIGGIFSSVNGSQATNLARLNLDGTLDTSFQSGLQLGSVVNLGSLLVRTLAVQADGKPLASGLFFKGSNLLNFGRFSVGGGVDGGYLASVDNSRDSSSTKAILLQPDGKALIGGSITNVNGTGCNGMARLNTDGSLDAGFQPGIPSAFTFSVTGAALQTGGKVLFGGYHQVNSLVEVYGVVRLFTTAPIFLNSPVFTSDGRFQISLAGQTGTNYVIQAATNLATGNWISVQTNATPFTFTDSNAPSFPQRFYRAVFPQ